MTKRQIEYLKSISNLFLFQSKLTATVRLRKASKKPVPESKENNSNTTISTSEILNSLWACFNEIASQSQSGSL